jgi:hypothetical protein
MSDSKDYDKQTGGSGAAQMRTRGTEPINLLDIFLVEK